MSIKNLIGRLRRLEARTGASSLSDFYKCFSMEELEAIVDAYKLPPSQQAKALSDTLGWTVERSQAELAEADRLSGRKFAGWSKDRLVEYLQGIIDDDEDMRDQFDIWLSDELPA